MSDYYQDPSFDELPLFASPKVEPVSAPTEDTPRLTGQNAAILRRLRQGTASNFELAAISLKYTSRINDLRNAGYRIEAERGSGGVWIYELKE